jgi:hypothetical protein
MRLLRTLLLALFAAVALTAGLVVTAIVAVAGAAIYLAARLFRIGPAKRRTIPPAVGPKAAKDGDVIDVTATEIR